MLVSVWYVQNRLGGIFHELDDAGVDMLEKMLDFNPAARITAEGETLLTAM